MVFSQFPHSQSQTPCACPINPAVEERFQVETYEKSRASRTSPGSGERGHGESNGSAEKEEAEEGGERRKDKVSLQLSESLCDLKTVSPVLRLVEASVTTTAAPHLGHTVKITLEHDNHVTQQGPPPSLGSKRLRTKGTPKGNCSLHLGAARWPLPRFHVSHLPH